MLAVLLAVLLAVACFVAGVVLSDKVKTWLRLKKAEVKEKL